MFPNASSFIQPTLTGPTIELRPLEQAHQEALVDAAADGELWNMKVTVVPGPETVGQYIATALAGQQTGTVMPFVIVKRETGQIVGSTRFWKIDRINRKLEIGHSWLRASVQRSGVNTEAKYLLLTYAFESIHHRRTKRKVESGDLAHWREAGRNRPARAHHARRPQAQLGSVQHHRFRVARGKNIAAAEDESTISRPADDGLSSAAKRAFVSF